MRLRAVIFDVDGTLVDSERDGHRVAFNAAFVEAGLPGARVRRHLLWRYSLVWRKPVR